MFNWRFLLLVLALLAGCASVDRRAEYISFYHCGSRFVSSPLCDSGYYFAPVP